MAAWPFFRGRLKRRPEESTLRVDVGTRIEKQLYH